MKRIDPLARRTDPVGDRLELRAVVDGERHQRFRLRRRVVAQWMWLIASSLRSARWRAAVLEEIAQLRPRRIFRRAEEARDREGAAGVRPGRAGLERLVAKPAAQEPGHEGVAGAEHVVDLDRETLADDPVVERRRDRTGKDDAAHRPALQDDGRRRDARGCARSEERASSVAAGDADLLLRADDEIAVGEHALQMLRNPVRLDEALLAGGVAGEAPKVRAIVDVEHDLASGGLCDADRLPLSGVGVRLGEMRPGDEDGPGRGDQGRRRCRPRSSAMSAQFSR